MGKPDPRSWDLHAVKGSPDPIARDRMWQAIDTEVSHSMKLHGCPRWGRHEMHSIVQEEWEEAWQEIKEDGHPFLLIKELVQTAAMIVRYCETDPTMQKCLAYLDDVVDFDIRQAAEIIKSGRLP